jgi:hypothetical protein
MKITKRGIPLAERKWIGKCAKCGSEAEAMEAELTHITHDQRDGSFSWEICPVCKAGNPKTGYGGMCFHPAHH